MSRDLNLNISNLISNLTHFKKTNTQNIPQKNVESFCSQMTHFCTDRTAKRPLISKIQVKVYLPQKKKISINFPFFLKKEKSNLVVAVVAVHCRPGATSLVKNFWWKVMFFLFFFLRIHFLMQMGSTLSPHAGHLRCGREQNTFVFAFDSTARLVIYGEFVEVIEMKRQNEWPNMRKMRIFELNFSKNNYLAFF